MTEDYFTRCGRAGIPLANCTVIDAHVHIGTCAGITLVDSSVPGLIRAMDRIGIDRAAVSSFQGVYGMSSEGNDLVAAAVREHSDRFIGYMTLNPGYPDQVHDELQRSWERGFRHIKIWSYGGRPGLPYDHPSYQRIFRFADQRRCVVLAHTWGGELDELEETFESFPRARWVCAHTGSRDLHKYIRAANTYDQVYLETCLSSCPRGLIEDLTNQVPLRKILWGSDQLFINATQQIGRVLFAEIPEESKRAILGLNAAELFD